MTIAGSDSGAGAGIQADIKTMGALGVFGTTVDHRGHGPEHRHRRARCTTCHRPWSRPRSPRSSTTFPSGRSRPDCSGDPAIVEVVGRRAAAGDLPQLVVDPVMVASTGRIFLVEEGIDAYRRHLLPQALVATPNLWEAALLADRAPTGEEDVEAMVDMARRIHELGPTWVLVKGGHLPGVESQLRGATPDQVADVLFDGTDGHRPHRSHVDTPNTHGTGCSLSAAIAAYAGPRGRRPHRRLGGQGVRPRRPAGRGRLAPRPGPRAPRPPGMDRPPSPG